MRILIINPNTHDGVRARLESTARAVADAGDHVVAVCAPSGIDLIVSEAEQRIAAGAVLDCAVAHSRQADAIIIGSFGDTGIDLVRRHLDVQVVGIAEAAMQSALAYGPKPAIVSFSEAMRPSFVGMLRRLGLTTDNIDVHLLPARTLPDPGQIADVLKDDLLDLAHLATRQNASCLVTGGGPLAGLAQTLRGAFDIPVIDGTEEAVKRLRSGQPVH